MNKKYIVRLAAEERERLEALVKKGKGAAHRIKHAHILLGVDAHGAGATDESVAKALSCHVNTVRNVRQRLVEQGLEAALDRKAQERPSRERILDGRGEARLITLACSKPPSGRARWTLRLLADHLVELEVAPSISEQTVRRTLKKTNCTLTCASNG
jgi:transposase